MDALDREILRQLRIDGRASYRELGEAVGLGSNAVAARVRRLLDEGIVTGIHAAVDHARLGRSIEADVDCWLGDRTPASWERFAAFVTDDERILEAVHLTGKVDFRLRVVVASPTELDELLTALKTDAAITETDTRLILRRYPTIHRR